MAVCHPVRTLDKTRMGKLVGEISAADMAAIEHAVRQVYGLYPTSCSMNQLTKVVTADGVHNPTKGCIKEVFALLDMALLASLPEESSAVQN